MTLNTWGMMLLAVFAAVDANACKRSGNRANVTAMDEGIFYARSVPATIAGIEGKTDIYKVGNSEDERIDSYNWFNRNKLVLAWSPKTGQVAILKYDPENAEAALEFYMGGKFLKRYSLAALKGLGIKTINTYCALQLDLKILGQEQMPNTNDYVFKIDFGSSSIKMFDITTGELVSKK